MIPFNLKLMDTQILGTITEAVLYLRKKNRFMMITLYSEQVYLKVVAAPSLFC